MKMNNIKDIFAAFALVAMFSACTLEPEVELQLTKEDVSHTYGHTMARAQAVYNFLPNGLSYIDGAMLDSATDDAEHTAEGCAIQKFNTGSWNQLDNPDGAYERCFNGIYAANLYLNNFEEVDLDHYRLDPDPSVQQLYELYKSRLERSEYEVRFLRAFYYFELVERYGAVPLMTGTYDVNDDISGITRTPVEEIFDFIASECDEIVDNLPAAYEEDGDAGRITKGAVMMLKSRALLYKASDLFNDPSWADGYSHPEYISVVDGDRTKQWEDAARASEEVISLISAARYVLTPNYNDIFLNAHKNMEVILARRVSTSSYSFEQTNMSVGFDRGNSGTTPSQNLVDAFEMKSGKPFDWNDPAMAADPYANRDPRLGLSIIVNGSTFKERTMEIYKGGVDGKGVTHATRTGYYLKKYVNPDVDLLQGRGTPHSWVIFRLAEAYLNLAEAMNEAFGPDAIPDGFSMSATQAVNKIRGRKGVELPGLSGLSQEELRERIRNERRVELCFEGHRAFDVRRWMIAEKVLAEPIRGIEAEYMASRYAYTPVDVVENRTFLPKMYFYPIPQTDLQISGWAQNPLW